MRSLPDSPMLAGLLATVSFAVGCAFLAGPVAAAPSKAEIGAMLKKCSSEADAKGLTVQKGKGAERMTYRRQCMQKNGVAPRKS